MAKKLQFTGKFSTDGSIPSPSSAAVGQTLVVKAVDENGKPTEWETLDTLGMAKAYSDSKGGYVEPGKVLTFDGNIEGKEQLPKEFLGDIEYTLIKISDDYIDVKNVTSLTITTQFSGRVVLEEYTADSLMVETQDLLGSVRITTLGDVVAIFSVGVPYAVTDTVSISVGTYVLYDEMNSEDRVFVSSITMSDTIVPIKPEYLPEGGFGYSEPRKVLTFDGNIEDKTLFPGLDDSVHFSLVKISETVIVPTKVTIENIPTEGERMTFLDSQLVTSKLDDRVKSYNVGSQPIVVTVRNTFVDENMTYEAGTYVCVSNEVSGMFVSQIESEIIHTIEQKYIPGVTINLADYGVNIFDYYSVGTHEQYIVNADALWRKVRTTDGPITLVGEESSTGVTIRVPMNLLDNSGEGSLLVASTNVVFNGITVTVHIFIADDWFVMDVQELHIGRPPHKSLPVVNLTTPLPIGSLWNGALSADESVNLQDAHDTGLPCIISIPNANDGLVPVSAVFANIADSDGVLRFAFTQSNVGIVLECPRLSTNDWTAKCIIEDSAAITEEEAAQVIEQLSDLESEVAEY